MVAHAPFSTFSPPFVHTTLSTQSPSTPAMLNEKGSPATAKGLDDEMIASARNYIMGQFPPSLETASSLAGMFAYLELYGLDRTYIDDYGPALNNATPVTVHNTISDVYPLTENFALILIGDAGLIRDEVAKYGEVVEMSIEEPSFRP